MTTICANLIVRDESHVIKRCLDSLLPFVDHLTIVDTGSTDGTQATIQQHAYVDLHERPWKNFGHNREEALHLARQSGCDYILFMDADDVLTAPTGFQWPELTAPGYTLPIDYGTTAYSRCVLVRSDAPWRWEGVVHEYLTSDTPLEQQALLQPRIKVMHDGARSKDPATYAKDAALLEEELKKHPADARTAFYLAQSYRDDGRTRLALEAYERRAAMAGWEEEGWYSAYEVARQKERLGLPFSDVIGAYLAAFQRRPIRAETFCMLASYLRLRGEWNLAYLFSKMAVSMKKPTDRLFVDTSVYDWRALDELSMSAYYVGAFDEGKAATVRLLTEGKLPDSERPRVENNLRFYNAR